MPGPVLGADDTGEDETHQNPQTDIAGLPAGRGRADRMNKHLVWVEREKVRKYDRDPQC